MQVNIHTINLTFCLLIYTTLIIVKKLLFPIVFLCFAGCVKKDNPEMPAIADFRTDPKVSALYESIKPLQKMAPTHPEALRTICLIKTKADLLVSRYTLAKCISYSRELAQERQYQPAEVRQQPGCCTLNTDLTTNWSCCNFFETLVVTFETLGLAPAEGATRAQILQYYKLVQASICANC